MKAVPDVEDEDEIRGAIEIPLKAALKNLDYMRRVEGEKLAEDLMMRGGLIRESVKKIEERSPQVAADYAEKLKERIRDLIGSHAAIPEDRILLEAAVFADKCNITEELVRLDSHMIQMKNIIEDSSQPTGKKLDFLVQEMNRETNTIGSKANDLSLIHIWKRPEEPAATGGDRTELKKSGNPLPGAGTIRNLYPDRSEA